MHLDIICKWKTKNCTSMWKMITFRTLEKSTTQVMYSWNALHLIDAVVHLTEIR